jgi:hypothetical protein
VGSDQIVYSPRGDATPEAELSALANIYAFALQKHQERQKAARPGGPDDERKVKNALADTHCT